LGLFLPLSSRLAAWLTRFHRAMLMQAIKNTDSQPFQTQIEMKKARSIASGLYVYVEPRADYGSLCGDVVMVLNVQLTCGTEPTKDVLYVPPAGQPGTLLLTFSLM
jgi:hypothetical protein